MHMLWVRALHVHCVVSHEKMTKENMNDPRVTFYSEIHANGTPVEWLNGRKEKCIKTANREESYRNGIDREHRIAGLLELLAPP